MTTANLLTAISDPDNNRVLEFDPAFCFPAPGNRPVTPESVADLLPSMEQTGQLVPGIVYWTPEMDPRQRLVADGNRRVLCCRILGRPFRAIELDHAPTAAELRRIRFTTNAISKHATEDERAADVVAHIEETGCSYREAAQFFGISASYGWKLAAETRLLPELAHLKTNPNVCRDVRRIIATMPTDELQCRLAERVAERLAKGEAVKRDSVDGWAAEMKLAAGRGQTRARVVTVTYRGIKITFTITDPSIIVVPFAEILAAVKKLLAEKRPLADLPKYLKGA